MAIVLAAGLAAQPLRAAVRSPEDLMIVDCLLPGQVRKLGKVSSFMTARRPIRTTQGDCEIRGGEYVSYDRANYQTALKIWTGQAEAGDAEAQNYVGEIYAKGLGIDPDYVKARGWYEKSAAQGNKRAKINLGYLYEQGLGTDKDLTRALNLYRDASGATGDDLVFASTVTVGAEAQAEIASLKETVETQRQESEALKAKIRELEQQLSERRKALGTAQRELEDARAKVIRQQAAVAPQSAPELDRLRAELVAREDALKKDRAALDSDRAAFSAKTRADQAKLAELRAQESKLEGQVKNAAPNTDVSAAKKDLDRVRSAAAEMALALDDAYGKIAALEAKLSGNDQRLAAEQARFDSERQKMQTAVAGSKQDRELLLLLEQQLAQKQGEVSRQRDQIASLEAQFSPTAVGGSTIASIANAAGPLVELIEPALTATRGKPAGMVRSSGGTTEVLGKVLARAGISSLTVNGQVVPVAANGLFRVTVPVEKDGTAVAINALDNAGKKTQIDFMLLQMPGAKAGSSGGSSTVALRSVPRGVNMGRYFALVVGNNDYAAYPKLSSAGNDAQKVAAVLKSKYGFDARLLQNATRMDMLSALNDLRETLKPEDNLLVYFAGHGELDSKAKEGYWIPVDGQPKQPGSWVSNRAISDILNSISARHVLVIADSCYSGSMTRASVPVSSAVPDGQWEQWIKTMSQSRSRTALTSGGLAPVPDSGGGQNSYFARALLTALGDNNQVIEGQKLFRQVTTGLALASAESTLIQSPEYAPIAFSGHEAGEFFFVPKG